MKHILGRQFICSALFCIASLGGAFCAASAAEIQWSIGNRFRAFDYLDASVNSDPLKSTAYFETFSPRQGESDFQQWVTRIAKAGGSPFARAQGPWDEGRAAYDSKFLDLPEKMLLQLSLKPGESGKSLLVKNCEWLVGSLPVITAKCSEAISAIVPAVETDVTVLVDGAPLQKLVATPKLRIVLGMGDSYGAGEGSPDKPTQWHQDDLPGNWSFGNEGAIDKIVKEPASWWSSRCNRSFYSYQNLVALKQAADDPHAIVAFLHLACAGAEVVDGLLAPQRMAPGHPKRDCDPAEDRIPFGNLDTRCDVPLSQIRSAINHLCRVKPTPLSTSALADIQAPLQKLRYASSEAQWIVDLAWCPAEQIRPVDLMIVSIGGNDMGFSGVIAWGLLPSDPKNQLTKAVVRFARKKGHVVCPYPNAIGGCTDLNAQERIAEIPARYNVLGSVVSGLLKVPNDKVLTTQYTDPLTDQAGNLCGDTPGSTKDNAWMAARIAIPVAPFSWQINLTAWEAQQVREAVIPRLNAAIGRASASQGWMSADTSQAMLHHGWCTGDQVRLGFPRDLSRWDGLSSNLRYIRTVNDAVRTQWPGFANRDDGFNGSLHPNVQGYAAIADAVQRVLASQAK